jgi:TonB family protein
MYPTDLRNAGIEDKTLFEFVVDANGRVDLTTVQVMSSTATQFVKSVLDVLPDHRFDPLYVEGCPVPVLVQVPFEFSLIRH